MTTYFVKVEATLHYDKNYEVEAKDIAEAGFKAKKTARLNCDENNFASWDYEWEFGNQRFDVITVEEAY